MIGNDKKKKTSKNKRKKKMLKKFLLCFLFAFVIFIVLQLVEMKAHIHLLEECIAENITLKDVKNLFEKNKNP